MKYRLYIDEVGNSDVNASREPNHRYLSLTGIIVDLSHVAGTMHPEIEKLKTDFFGQHPDEPLILHRKELVNRQPPFSALRNPAVELSFNNSLLGLINTLDYKVLTVVIDKLQHLEQYQVWRYDPYHYCMEVLIERYAKWLKRNGAAGDVLAESRGKREDLRLKAAFSRIHERGTRYVGQEVIQDVLTSKELKVKPKANNIAGLQLADLLAHPSYKCALARKLNQRLAENFGGRVAAILEESKYDRSTSGTIDGWGRKWLP